MILQGNVVLLCSTIFLEILIGYWNWNWLLEAKKKHIPIEYVFLMLFLKQFFNLFESEALESIIW